MFINAVTGVDLYLGEAQNILGAITDEGIGISQLLWDRALAASPRLRL